MRDAGLPRYRLMPWLGVPRRGGEWNDSMNPRAALDEQRLGIALALHELACDVAREGIRTRRPNADDAEVKRQR